MEDIVNKQEDYAILRSNAILEEFPLLKQLEAITEKDMGKPEKYNALLEHIKEVKETYPKPEE